MYSAPEAVMFGGIQLPKLCHSDVVRYSVPETVMLGGIQLLKL